MQDINSQSKSPRGSSPPFQESERWIDDGADGSHWVKTVSIGSQHQESQLVEQLDQKSGALMPPEVERHSEDDGGGGKSVPSFDFDSRSLSEK